ncbi:probable E3 ubiquitin-protein ligase ZFP1 [Phaseolus vulgaris]|uniref:probable E3 ubiquitin-protein ligase ZFP1 n=1 Tax=Phaseolus vulgaris TaxID=3885 RepID=UPI0035CC0E7A
MISAIGVRDMDEMSEGNIFWPNMWRVAVRENIDSHYLLDAHDNGMVYGRRAFNGVQHQPIHTGFPNSSSLAQRFSVAPPNARHNAFGIPLLPLSNHLIQAPTPSLEIATNDPQSNHDIVRSRSDYRFLHPQYQAQPTQEMRGNSIDFHPPLTLPTNPSNTFLHLQYQAQPAQEMRGHSVDSHPALTLPTNPLSTSSVHVTTPPHWRNLPPQAFLQDDVVPWLSDDDSDMHLDIDDMSYEELLELGERIGNVGTSLLDEIIARQIKTKTYLLPNNSGEVAVEEQEIDLCIICQDEYKNKQEIGILQCGHGYHVDCIRTWLHEKNVCPLCKSEALTLG